MASFMYNNVNQAQTLVLPIFNKELQTQIEGLNGFSDLCS